MLNKIIEDLDLNLKQTLMSKSNKTETKQKITLLKNINERSATIKKSRHWKATSIVRVAYTISWRSIKAK